MAKPFEPAHMPAEAMQAAQNELLAAQGIPVQGIGREAYRS